MATNFWICDDANLVIGLSFVPEDEAARPSCIDVPSLWPIAFLFRPLILCATWL
jgi:hypothetical protein